MSKLQIVLTKNTKKDILKLDCQIAKKIYKKLTDLIKLETSLQTATRLTKPADAQYRWRFGNYRILFDFDHSKNLVIILKIQHRRQVYR